MKLIEVVSMETV